MKPELGFDLNEPKGSKSMEAYEGDPGKIATSQDRSNVRSRRVREIKK